jgi:hypothetical protein
MARGIKNWSRKLIEQRIREGYGAGEGSAYKPWIRTTDFSSAGRISRPYSAKCGRTIELVSDVESNTFYMLEFAPTVVQIYEQYRLEQDETLQIAAALGIPHPFYPGTNVETVMTVDFLVLTGSLEDPSYLAIDCKRSEDAGDPRTLEKLQITHAYFAGRDVPHRLVYHSQLPMQMIRNIEWARGAAIKPGQIEPTPEHLREQAELMIYELKHANRSSTLAEYCAGFESRHGLRMGMGLRIARYLIWEHRLECDMRTPRLETAPLASFAVDAMALETKRASGL